MTNFSDKKFLITGHTGFQGFWLSNMLFNLGFKKIYGIGLKPKIFQNKIFQINNKTGIFLKSYYLDIFKKKQFHSVLNDIQPDYIFHLASQPLVKESFLDPVYNFDTNIFGSINLLEWLRNQKKRKIKVIFVTSDKCYQPSRKPHIEEDHLGGLDPYSSSKSIQELLVKSYQYSFFSKENYIRIATARSGNIYGGGDFTPGRLVPDIIDSIFSTKKLIIRNPNYVRPWQYIVDSMVGYIKLSQYLSSTNYNYESFNFGPRVSSSVPVINLLKRIEKISKKNLNTKILKKNEFNENNYLRLISKKANKTLNWKNNFTLDKGLRETYFWYKNYFENFNNIIDYTQKKITEINLGKELNNSK